MRHFEAEIILLCLRWYIRYPLSYHDYKEMMQERRLDIDHITIYCWVHDYAPELIRRCRHCLKSNNDSYRVDETYIRLKKNGSISIGMRIPEATPLISY